MGLRLRRRLGRRRVDGWGVLIRGSEMDVRERLAGVTGIRSFCFLFFGLSRNELFCHNHIETEGALVSFAPNRKEAIAREVHEDETS
jgi:hypothetical protein